MTRRRLFDATVRDPIPIVKSVLDDTSPVRERSSNHISSSVTHTSGSWRFDPPRSGLKSTQQLHIDYSKFENHVFFNSARAKVNMAFDNIINRFPFDGTKTEVQNFIDNLNGFEKHVLDRMPKHKGSFAFLGSQTVAVSDRKGVLYPTLAKDTDGSAVLDPGMSSFAFDFQIFVPKNTAGSTAKLPIFHKINTEGNSGFTVYMEESNAFGSAPSGSLRVLVSDGISSVSNKMLIEKGKFEHVSINVVRNDDDARIDIYRNGRFVTGSESRALGTIKTNATSFMIASASSHAADVISGGKLEFGGSAFFSGSIDEFRFYHKARTEDEIEKNRYSNVFKDANLKLYYRFNEPSGSHPGNNVLLDSSGNSLHSQVNTFHVDCRGLRGSALVEEIDTYSPVLFPSNADLIDLNKKLLFTGTTYDDSNPNLITRLIPHHYLKEAQLDQGLADFDGGVGDQYGSSLHVPGSGEISQPQIISGLLFTWASLFDDLKLYIQTLGEVDYVSLVKSGSVPDQLLIDKAERLGFPLPDMYSNASLAQFLFGASTQNEKGLITKPLNAVQNEVWRRVLADLPEVLRSKGTIHSIESFLRDVGIEPGGIFRLREFGGSRKIYLGKSRVKRKETTPFLQFTSSYNKFAKSYDGNDIASNYPSLKSPFLIASRSEPGSPGLTRHHSLSEYYVSRGKEYGSSANLITHLRYTSGSNGKISHPGHSTGLALIDVSGLASVQTGSAHNTGRGGYLKHGKITGSMSSVYSIPYAEYPNGQSDYGTIADNNALSVGASGFSISFWAQFSEGHPGNNKMIIIKSSEYALKFDGSGDLVYTLIDSSSGPALQRLTVPMPASHRLFDGNWHMITLSHAGGGGNSGTNTQKINLYIDSILEANGGTVSGGNFAEIRNTANNIFISFDPAAASVGCKINISEIGLWNASLDASNVEGIYGSYAREENKKSLGPDLPSGLLTSGSWGYEGWYKFKNHYIDGKPKKMPSKQSLVRFYTTGSAAPASKGALIGNLILNSGSDDSGHSLTLYMRPNIAGDLMTLHLTGANYFDGTPWHISLGRVRNDMTGSVVSSSYYLRAGAVANGNIKSFAETSVFYKDNADYSSREGQSTSIFSSGSAELNSSGTFFVIGESRIQNLSSGGKFLHDQNITDDARIVNFRGQTGPIRFFSKELSIAETREHIRNYRSTGVENPHINYNFNNQRTGSFERLRMDVHLDQDIVKVSSDGSMELFDFSNNKNHINVAGSDPNTNPFDYSTMEYSIFSPHIDRSVTSSKVRVRGYKGRENVKQHFHASFSPVYDINPFEENLDDNRFSVEVSAVQGVNEDIMNILGTMDEIENAIGQPNLAFESEYHDLIALREVYFKRLTGKVNFKEFFAFFKWFDRSIGKFIDYLLPSKTNFLGTNFIIESHFLERHKYRYYFDDIYLGESDRDNLKGEIKLQLITGSIKRL